MHCMVWISLKNTFLLNVVETKSEFLESLLFYWIKSVSFYMISITSSPPWACFLAFSFISFIFAFRSSIIFLRASSRAFAASDFSFGFDLFTGVFLAVAVLLFFTTSGFCKRVGLIFHSKLFETFCGILLGKVLTRKVETVAPNPIQRQSFKAFSYNFMFYFWLNNDRLLK